MTSLPFAAAQPQAGIPAARHAERLARARALAAEQGLDALLVGVGADLRYLAGYDALALERLTLLVVPVAGRPTLLAPRLEAAATAVAPAIASGEVHLETWEETDDPLLRVRDLLGDRAGRLAVSDRLAAHFLLGLQALMPDASWSLASAVVGRLRIVKDADEVALLERAAHAADQVIHEVVNGRLVGRTEADVAREIRDRLIAWGHDRADFAIVGSGPNSASPHHAASDRVIRPGEPIVLDIGGPMRGYGSDITRTVWVTGGDPTHGPDRGFLRLYGVLRGAQAEATHAVRPGVAAERIDLVARELISAAGYGQHFIHRTGHGIGLEEHEPPYIVAGNVEPIRPGMAFSVEPGIYLEGRYGARIEDIVVCAEDGPMVLNEASRDLLVVTG
ncbi:MAG: putative dipeptidase pepE [Chloroflexi bacterium]|nr:putative dipeptidase pepE [Chloroflexota bacterium]